MRSEVEVGFYSQNAPVGTAQILNRANVHPDITDFFSWGDLVNAVMLVYDSFKEDWGSAKSDAEKLYETAIKGKDVNTFRNSQLSFKQGEWVSGIPHVVDEVRIWFRAWSEDDLTKSFGKVDAPGQIQDLGERTFKKGDDHWYERGFALSLPRVRVGPYIFNFASGDDGWHFDVGIASTLAVSISPGRTRGSSGFFIQSNNGKSGNFEVIVPRAEGGLAHYWRNTDKDPPVWEPPGLFGQEALGRVDAVSLIQSSFSEAGNGPGNLDLIARVGDKLFHLWKLDTKPDWSGPAELGTGVTGNPAFIQSRFGKSGNFEVIVPRTEGGLAHYWRNTDKDPPGWEPPGLFAQELGRVDAVSLIQSSFSEAGNGPGNLELIARVGDKLCHLWKLDTKPDWSGPVQLGTGVTGNPAFIQSRFGKSGNFEVIVPRAEGGLAHYWRNTDKDPPVWEPPGLFAQELGRVDTVSLIQSSFSEAGNGPGNLELIARVGDRLVHLWKFDNGISWSGPITIASGR